MKNLKLNNYVQFRAYNILLKNHINRNKLDNKAKINKKTFILYRLYKMTTMYILSGSRMIKYAYT